MVQHHKYSLNELENMFPYELDFYITMLVQYLKQQEENAKKMNKGN